MNRRAFAKAIALTLASTGIVVARTATQKMIEIPVDTDCDKVSIGTGDRTTYTDLGRDGLARFRPRPTAPFGSPGYDEPVYIWWREKKHGMWFARGELVGHVFRGVFIPVPPA